MSNNCKSEIVKYFVVQPNDNTLTGSTGDFNVGGDLYVCNSGSTLYTEIIEPCVTGVTISSNFTVYNTIVEPTIDDNSSLGTPTRRWRQVNTVSGTSTVWASTDRVITPNLDLGLDSNSESRIITANNSVIQDDILDAGGY